MTTPVEIVLLALIASSDEAQPANADTTGGAGDALTLAPTQFGMASDNVAMTRVQATRDGRIFLAGADGHLYELTYDTGGGLLGALGLNHHPKCRKRSHSACSATWTPSARRTARPTFP